MRGFIALLVALGMAGEAGASAARCEGCSPGEMERTALELGSGHHVVASFATNSARFYEAALVESADGIVRLSANEIEGPPALRRAFEQARAFYVATNTTLAATINIDAKDLGDPRISGASTMDVVNNRALQVLIGDRLLEELPGVDDVYNEAIAGVRSGAFSMVGMPAPVLTYYVTMGDGGVVGYRVDEFAATGATFQADMTRDASGGVIAD